MNIFELTVAVLRCSQTDSLWADRRIVDGPHLKTWQLKTESFINPVHKTCIQFHMNSLLWQLPSSKSILDRQRGTISISRHLSLCTNVCADLYIPLVSTILL